MRRLDWLWPYLGALMYFPANQPGTPTCQPCRACTRRHGDRQVGDGSQECWFRFSSGSTGEQP